mmetsp:Transcript_17896/g.50419  ORF Transcript_17896/g.50419 Transcript_17896/m.50419 type:complete len:136 (-) Transcript_17896:784-1191(-)
MLQEMVRSQFCLAIPEIEGWSLRIFDAIALGCIPVLLTNQVNLPFESFLDYSEFAIKVPEDEKDGIVNTLRAIPADKLREKQKALEKAAPALLWPEVGGFRQGDALDFFLKEMQLKLRFQRNSPYRFWTEPVAFG